MSVQYNVQDSNQCFTAKEFWTHWRYLHTGLVRESCYGETEQQTEQVVDQVRQGNEGHDKIGGCPPTFGRVDRV